MEMREIADKEKETKRKEKRRVTKRSWNVRINPERGTCKVIGLRRVRE